MDISERPGVSTRASAELFDIAQKVIPAGVNSTARTTFAGWSPYPLFIASGSGPRITDVDGNTYIDYLLGLGPMILGHRPASVTRAVVDYIEQRGTIFALPTADEAVLAQRIVSAVPSIEQLRFCNTGTEAVLYAVRLARAFTGRQKLILFEGMYHGFSDGVYWSNHPPLDKAGPDEKPVAVPQNIGLPREIEKNLIVLPWNDAELLGQAIAREGANIAAVITEPVMCNTGCILPRPGYLEAMRKLATDHGIVLIFDEVITGFRLGLAGAQGLLGISPDLTVFAKGLGGGFPIAALGGRGDIMALVATGKVSMSGTYSANGIAVAAGLATLDALSAPGLYAQLFAVSDRLRHGLTKLFAKHGVAAFATGVGPLLQVWFSEAPIHNYRDAVRHADRALFRRWFRGMLNRGILFHPGAYENLFVSTAHTTDDIDRTLAAAEDTILELLASPRL
jgi:glutamate-1-semialdehyde 2,1-aminomutase